MRIRALLITVLLSAVAVPATANAAVTIGSPLIEDATTNSLTGNCMVAACTYIQTDASVVPVPQYVVPANVTTGVITSWSFKASSGNNTLQALRPQGSGIYVEAGHSAPEPAAGGNTIATFATRLPVQAGDTIGLENDSNALVMRTSPTIFAAGDVVREFHPVAGAAPAIPTPTADHSQLELQAKVEPDADADGFGDETQDLCPSDPLLQTACSSDLQVSATGTPSKVKAGQIVGYIVTVHNAGTSPAANTTLTVALPAGLTPTSLASTVGGCGAASCSLGTLANGATATVTFSVATTKPGTFTATSAVASTVADPGPANNTASVTTTVVPAALTLTGLAVFPKTFHRGSGLPRLSPRAKAKPSAIKFTLSEAASVKLTFAQIGRRNHILASGAFSVAAKAGDSRLIFSGVLPNHHRLKPGRYRLTASAVTSDRRRARASAVRFTALRAR